MITIGYSTRVTKPSLQEYFKKTCGLKDVEVIEVINNGEKSLAQVYNEIIDISTNNILVLCHDDIKLETGWGKKLLRDFEDNPDFSIIGKAGSCYFPESGVYWEKMNQTMVGQVYHHPDGQKKWLNKYSPKLPFIIPVVTIDGLFISFDKTKIKHKFDETIGKFHFYDHGFCIPNYLDGVKIGVTSSFEITHKSVGQPNEEFWVSKNQFLQKWGSKLPLDLKPDKVFIPEIKEKLYKKIERVAVIIPHKNNYELLFECVSSFFRNCNQNLFKIFIADTGSSEEEKKLIKENILTLGDIRLIEYDYYNFSKINNDVVKNYVTEDFGYLLFCNNDVSVQNNIIYEMMNTFKTNPNAGSVGARLHYSDNTIQHDGMLVYLKKDDKLIVSTHKNQFNYYNYSLGVNSVIGNTAALLMVPKNLFLRVGMFNENYRHCFEDVELSIKLKSLGLKNFVNSNCVAYHFESKTRDIKGNDKEMIEDYNNFFVPTFKSLFEKIKNEVYTM